MIMIFGRVVVVNCDGKCTVCIWYSLSGSVAQAD